MARLTVADLLRHQVVLAPLEATALTLAVAREVDRCRAAGHDTSVPDDAWIVLHRNGEVTFATPDVRSSTDDVVALCALLARLLRVRQPDAASLFFRDGMNPVAFRAALARVTPDDPAVLASVYWRGASASRGGMLQASPAPGVRGRAERRRAQPPAAELRRSIRRLELELFDERQRLAYFASRGSRARMASRRWVAASVLLVLAATLVAWVSRGAPEAADRAPHVASLVDRVLLPATVETAGARIVPERASTLPKPSHAAPARAVHAVARTGSVAIVHHRTAGARQMSAPVFAGGTRAIAWAR